MIVHGVRELLILTDSLSNKNCDHVDIVHPTLFPSGKVDLKSEVK